MVRRWRLMAWKGSCRRNVCALGDWHHRGRGRGGSTLTIQYEGCSLEASQLFLHCVLSLKEDRRGVYGRGAHHGPILRELVPGPWKLLYTCGH